MRRFLATLALAAAAPSLLAAQSSQFGVRGLGMPGRESSVRGLATGGSFAPYDETSTLNPASVGGLPTLTASFSLLGEYSTSTNPAGSGSTRITRFPLAFFGGPIPRTRLAIALSASTYLDRDFGLATIDTVLLRGLPVGVNDTLTGRGGITDVRLAVAWRTGRTGAIGFGVHVLNGSTRTELRRTFGDSTYTAVGQSAELSASGVGFDVGFVQQIGQRIAVSGSARYDARVRIERDSTPAFDVNLPLTFTGGFKWRIAPKFDVAALGIYRTWSRSDAQLVAQGTAGAANTFELGAGLELLNDVRRPWRKPIRLGGRYATLPFYLERGIQAHEYAATAGTGTRFGGGRGGIDLTVERVWRADGTGRRDASWLVSLGWSVRP